MKILSIGNGLSRCAHRYLPKIAKCDGVSMILANLYAEHCSLGDYAREMNSDKGSYIFEYYDEGYVKLTEIENFTLDRALEWEDWDVITLQQSAALSGRADSYFPYVNELCMYIRKKCPSAKLLLHETWAYDSLYEGGEFGYYDRDSVKMQSMIKNAYSSAAKECSADGIIPAGEAFSIEREKYGEALTGDGIHGNRAGDFIAGAVWYCALTGSDIRKNTYRLPFVDKELTVRLKNTAYEVCNGERI